MNDPVTVVVPCAGRGKRLGLPFPKELFPTPDGRVLLDGIFDLIQGLDVRVILVVGSDRAATIRYVDERYPDVPVAAVRQRAAWWGLAGAVRSAVPWTGERTVVLLPDQLLLSAPANGPVRTAARLLRTAGACFLAAWENDLTRIAVDGALTVQRIPGAVGLLRRLADKPGLAGAVGHNAVWFGFAFRHDVAEGVLDQLDLAAHHELTQAQFEVGPLNGAPVVDVPRFVDVGTWPAVHDLWSKAGAACG